MTRIAFIDDQQGELDPARDMMAAEGYEVERHRDSKFAFAVFNRRMADLVVINLGGHPSAAMSVLERIRQKWAVPVVMLLPARDEVDEILCLRMGADDVIVKPASARLLTARINGLMRRTRLQGSEGDVTQDGTEQVLTCGDLTLDPNRHEVIWKGAEVALTVTEFGILQSLVRRPGVVKNRDRLLAEVYADQVYVDDRTIDSHIKRIRKKIRVVDADFDAIETLYGVGYRFIMPRKASRAMHVIEDDIAPRLVA